MLKLTVLEFFGRLIPEALILVFAAYAFSKIKVDVKRYTLATILLSMCVFAIRLLPINYGVHTILNIITLTIIGVSIMKIETIKVIKSSIITAVLLYICEGINVAVLRLLIGSELDNIIKNEMLKTVYFLPSLMILALIVIVYYKYLKKRKKLSYV